MKENAELENDLIYEILVQVKEGQSFRSIMSKLGDKNFDRAIERCASYRYVKGMSPNRVANGNLTVDATDAFGLTATGEEYITAYQSHYRS